MYNQKPKRSIDKAAKPFAVFDIDGTVIRWQLYHAIADALVKLGHIKPHDFEPVKEARMSWKRRIHSESFKAYELRLVKAYEKLLVRLRVEQFTEAADQVFSEYKEQVYTYTRELIKSLRAQGYVLFAISNSQVEIVTKIAEYYGFDDCVGALYERRDDRFSGNVTVHLNDKDDVLRQLVAKHQVTWRASIAVGDSMSDAPMLNIVEQPIAFNPEQALFARATSAGWRIVIERKNVVYELESHNGHYVLA